MKTNRYEDYKSEKNQLRQLKECVDDVLDSTCGDRNLTCHLNMTQRFWCEESLCWFELDEFEAVKNMKFFINRMNSRLYGNAYQRHKRGISIVPSWVERGSVLEDLHYHCLIKLPEDRFASNSEEEIKIQMTNLIWEMWLKTPFGALRTKSGRPTSRNQRIKVAWQHEDSISYLSKFKTKSDRSLVDWENFHWFPSKRTLLN